MSRRGLRKMRSLADVGGMGWVRGRESEYLR
jgi:hypothetical protein